MPGKEQSCPVSPSCTAIQKIQRNSTGNAALMCKKHNSKKGRGKLASEENEAPVLSKRGQFQSNRLLYIALPGQEPGVALEDVASTKAQELDEGFGSAHDEALSE